MPEAAHTPQKTAPPFPVTNPLMPLTNPLKLFRKFDLLHNRSLLLQYPFGFLPRLFKASAGFEPDVGFGECDFGAAELEWGEWDGSVIREAEDGGEELEVGDGARIEAECVEC